MKIDLSLMSKAELTNFAGEYKVDVNPSMNKTDMAAAIQVVMDAEDAEAVSEEVKTTTKPAKMNIGGEAALVRKDVPEVDVEAVIKDLVTPLVTELHLEGPIGDLNDVDYPNSGVFKLFITNPSGTLQLFTVTIGSDLKLTHVGDTLV